MRLLQSEEALTALIALRANADFNRVVRDIAEYLEAKNKQLIYTKDVSQLPQLQGTVRGLVDLMEAIQEAPERLDKLRKGST